MSVEDAEIDAFTAWWDEHGECVLGGLDTSLRAEIREWIGSHGAWDLEESTVQGLVFIGWARRGEITRKAEDEAERMRNDYANVVMQRESLRKQLVDAQRQLN